MLFEKAQLQTTKWKNTKINFKTTGGVPSSVATAGVFSLDLGFFCFIWGFY